MEKLASVHVDHRGSAHTVQSGMNSSRHMRIALPQAQLLSYNTPDVHSMFIVDVVSCCIQ
jgi:hypothetical protein